jgi:small-conductance mechanosensitive channel
MLAYDINASDNLIARKRYTQLKVFQNIAVVIVVLLATALVLITFESIRQFGVSLLASAGVAGIIIGVSAQKLLTNLLAGLQIAITQPIRLDDAVLVENEFGWIEEINLTYVVVRVWDKRRVVLPTTYFIEKPFQNWTKTSSDLLGPIFLYVDFSVPIEALRAELDKILDGNKLWDGAVKVIQVTNCTDRAMELRILVSAVNAPTAWDLRVQVREKLIGFLQKNYPTALPKMRLMDTKLPDNDPKISGF